MIKAIIKKLLPNRIVIALRIMRYGLNAFPQHDECIEYDAKRFEKYSGCYAPNNRESLRAQIIMHYHVIEKGLTMPQRRFGFGVNVLMALMRLVDKYESVFGSDDPQVMHAASVVAAYCELHKSDGEIQEFVMRHKGVGIAKMLHVSEKQLFENNDSTFPIFAWSRHTVRNYVDKPVPIELIRKVVDLARSTPSACNRQHCRVHCVSNREAMGRILDLQNGNRGFGHLADKVLIVTADLEDTIWKGERCDVYLEGGMFLMNLCYSLFYYKVGHCILNWFVGGKEDLELRRIVKLKSSETVVAILSCGFVPDELYIAASPRKPLSDYLIIHEDENNLIKQF